MKKHHFYGAFYDFLDNNKICANFHYRIRNQRTKIRKCTEFQENRTWVLFGTLPFELKKIFLNCEKYF